MLTRCPQCNTAFRVTSEQLKARQGRVRCGECQEVFNALDTLVEAMPTPVPSSVPAPLPEQAERQNADIGPTGNQAVPPAPMPAAEEPQAFAAALHEPETTAAEMAAPAVVARVEPAIAPEPPAALPSPGEEHELEPWLHEQPARRSWPWALGAAVALFALMAQAAIHFRTEIATLYPDTKPALVAACGALGCEVTLPRKPDLVGIETSDLHPDAGGKLLLTATLKNRAPFAQEFPCLELSLTDTNDQPLVRRVLQPAEYLSPKTSVPAGFKANSDLALNLAVEAPGVAAAGYRLYLFYP